MKQCITTAIAISFFLFNSIALAICQAKTSTDKITERVSQEFNNSNFECAIGLVSNLRQSSLLAQEEGVNERFVLRNLALKINSDTSSDIKHRFGLVNAATYEGSIYSNKNSDFDKKYDALLFYKAGNQYFKEQNSEYWLKSLISAIKIEQKESYQSRELNPVIYSGLTTKFNDAYDNLPLIIELANLIRHDRVLFRYLDTIYSDTEYNISIWEVNRTKDEVLNRAVQALELARLLDGCSQCYEGWQHNRYTEVAIAYYNLGMIKEAEDNIRKAINYAEEIKNPEARLRTENTILLKLHNRAPNSSKIFQELQRKTATLSKTLSPIELYK